MTLRQQAQFAKQASYQLLLTDTQTKNKALLMMADALVAETPAILSANAKDMDLARAAGRTESWLDRLALNESRIIGMAEGLRKVASLPDPVGGADSVVKRPNGLSIEKRRVPLGVIGIIYEARPNVTADAIGLCLKSSNACVLRGGSEAIHTNAAVANCLSAAAYRAGVPEGAIQLVQDTSRETATELMCLNGLIDVLIPRGGAGLIRSVVEHATVPVIETGAGVCHVYVDQSADLDMAARIVANAKCSRPAVCNACETMLVHQSVAAEALPKIAEALSAYHTEIRGCEKTCAILPTAIPAAEADWAAEYGDYIIAAKVVANMDEAIEHIHRYGTRHSEAIITDHLPTAERFLNAVDAAAVFVNASTRFTDGEEFGFGAEIGISTQKLHARGPMGLHELTSVKYVVRGNGQVR